MLDELGVEPEHFDLLPAYVDQYAYTAALMVRVLLMNPKVILLDDFLRLYNRSAGNALLSYMLNHVREQQMAAIIHNHDVGQLLTQHNRAIYFGHDDIICFDPASDMRSIGEERIQRMLGNVYLS
jgi:ABC-type Mn2+/Zn2+ transport system ATPase subunit